MRRIKVGLRLLRGMFSHGQELLAKKTPPNHARSLVDCGRNAGTLRLRHENQDVEMIGPSTKLRKGTIRPCSKGTKKDTDRLRSSSTGKEWPVPLGVADTTVVHILIRSYFEPHFG